MRDQNNLDLLRAFAVTLVVYDHTAFTFGYHVTGGGIFGVFLFFLHTSLVLMWSLERQPFVLPFYIRRAFRIYPLAITAILTAILFHLPVAVGGGWYTFHPFSSSTVLANLLLIENITLRPIIVGVFWTLSIEIQMYLLLPVLFFFVLHERRLWQPLVLWVLAVAVVRVSIPLADGNTLITVAPDFLAGVVAFIAFQKFRPCFPAWLFLPFMVALLGAYLLRPNLHTAWPITLLLGLTLPLFHQIRARPIVFIAKRLALYSYGIYVWHEFGMKLAAHLLIAHTNIVKIAAELLFTFAVAILGYHLIEAPAMKLGGRLQQLAHPKLRPPIPELEPVP